jgi:hypothetical protein
MKERPIIFSANEVRAILEGRRTQTRRVLKEREMRPFISADRKRIDAGYVCPYGEPGDRLWVREDFRYDIAEGPSVDVHGNPRCQEVILYRLDNDEDCMNWRPAIHMPRYASRITLEITDVRVERLQDISGYDACCEGVDQLAVTPTEVRDAFQSLWDSTNAKRARWASNPWVWVVSFERCEANSEMAA